MEIFLTVSQQVVSLFLCMFLGFLLVKTRLIRAALSEGLSKLLIYLFLPALCFQTMANNVSLEVCKSYWPLLAVSAVLLLLAYAAARGLARVFGGDRAVYVYSFTVTNIGYLGYPVVAAVFGEETLFHFMLFALPFNVFIYTIGIAMFSGKKDSMLARLVNPALISLFAGIALGLSGLKLPEFLSTPIASMAGCMSPMAMLLTGMVVAEIPLRDSFCDASSYWASLIRLLVLPALTFGLGWLLKLPRETLLCACCLMCLPFGMNSIVFPKAYGGDAQAGARLCLTCNALSVVTIPVMLTLFSLALK